jgi:hypothetical protein
MNGSTLPRLLPPPGPLPDAPARVVFDRFSAECEAAHCHLAATVLQETGDICDVLDYHYAFSLGLPSTPPKTAYVHYFHGPDRPDGSPGALASVQTLHTPGVDDLGGLVQIDT